MSVVIRVEALSKQYRIGTSRAPYETLRESLTRALAAPFRRRPGPRGREGGPASDVFWALRDVSFEVRQGEALGVIGRNGAGKSTLLKILSRITEPTAGSVTLQGRVGSLLEIGTGFHPELTGRENIFLNGAILGMRRAEIQQRFDDIVAFAEVERFLETPVKRYSTGMYMRLAFAVAAHLEPEIVLVDEVLAVGDAAFQKKCLGKMGDIAEEGRTVIFVSHNMGAVASLCQTGLVLDAGRIRFVGPVAEAVERYLGQFSGTNDVPLGLRHDRTGSGEVKLTGFHLESETGERTEAIRNGHTARLVFDYATPAGRPARNVEFQIVVRTEAGEPLFQFGTRPTGQNFREVPPSGRLVCELTRFPLAPGRYQLDAYLAVEGRTSDYVLWLAPLAVVDGDYYGSGYRVFERESRFLVDGRVRCEAADPAPGPDGR
jgi:lipopolysaccharide transport system ATP-binding protein